MSEQDTGRENPFGETDKDKVETTDQQSTGQNQDHQSETLTQTDEEVIAEDSATGETTGENAGGFVGSKDEDSGEYLQEKGEQSEETDIEGSSTFGTNGE